MKNRSVMTYIMATWIISELILFAITTLFVHLYITQSAELDIRSSLSRQVSSLSDAIENENGKLSIDESKLERRYPDMYIAIIDRDGNVVWGSTPDGVKINTNRSIAPSKTDSGSASYYYIDRDIKYTVNGDSFVRAYVNENNILSNYYTVRLIAYGGMIILLALLTVIILFALKRFKRSIKAMESSVEKIGTSQAFDERMDTQGHYKEISSLIEANNRMLDRMNDVLKQQEQFSSDIAHELKTPIAVIKAQSQYALNNYELSDEEKQSFEVVFRQANRMQELVVTLLELSRLDVDDSNSETENIDLPEIVAAVCDSDQYKNDKKQVSFKINNNEVGEAYGNVSLVTIAVTNLISNAVKFSPDNAVVYVETGADEDYVYVKVRDNGVGMTDEEKERVFTRFFKSDSSRNSSGYGLGMPLALKIAEKHGGTIKVESKPNKGSCFTLYLARNKTD